MSEQSRGRAIRGYLRFNAARFWLTGLLLCLALVQASANTVQTEIIWNDREITIMSLHPKGRSIDRLTEIDELLIISQLDRPCPERASPSSTKNQSDIITSRKGVLHVQIYKCLNERTPFTLEDRAFGRDHHQRHISIRLAGAERAENYTLSPDYHRARIHHVGQGSFEVKSFAQDAFWARFHIVLTDTLGAVFIFVCLAAAMLSINGGPAPAIIGPFMIGLIIALVSATPLAPQRIDMIFLAIGLLILARASYDILSRTQLWSFIVGGAALGLLLFALPTSLSDGMSALAMLAGLALFWICIAFQTYMTQQLEHRYFIFLMGLMSGLWLAQSRYAAPYPSASKLATLSGEVFGALIGCTILIAALRAAHSLFDVLQPARTNIYRDLIASLFVAFGSFLTLTHMLRLV